MSSPWLELIIFAVFAAVLTATAVADLATCLPARRSLRELLAALAEGPNGATEVTLEQLQKARPTVRLIQGIALLVQTLLAVRLVQTWWPERALLVAAIMTTLVLVVFASALPLAILDRRGPLPSGGIRTLVRLLALLGTPLWLVSELIERPLSRLIPLRAVPIPTLVPAPTREEVVEEAEELIERVLRLDRLIARDIMVPRTDIVAVPDTATIPEAVEVARDSLHSRLPVYRETIDHVVGILHVRDLLRFIVEEADQMRVTEVMRPAYFIPESKRLDELLRDLQQQRVHMAIVVDEFGGTAGIVTIEDVLEEIVGEIQDEYDQEAPLVERISPEEAIVDGRITLEEIADIFHVSLEQETTTIGGLVQAHLGHIPQVGESVRVDGLEVTVLAVDGHRVRKLRVQRVAVLPPSSEDEEVDQRLR